MPVTAAKPRPRAYWKRRKAPAPEPAAEPVTEGGLPGRKAAMRPGRAGAGDRPDGRVTRHPAWAAFEEWVRDGAGGDATHRVVRPDLLECRREAWEFVWEVFKAGHDGGLGQAVAGLDEWLVSTA